MFQNNYDLSIYILNLWVMVYILVIIAFIFAWCGFEFNFSNVFLSYESIILLQWDFERISADPPLPLSLISMFFRFFKSFIFAHSSFERMLFGAFCKSGKFELLSESIFWSSILSFSRRFERWLIFYNRIIKIFLFLRIIFRINIYIYIYIYTYKYIYI